MAFPDWKMDRKAQARKQVRETVRSLKRGETEVPFQEPARQENKRQEYKRQEYKQKYVAY